jgi:hypothetical protein
MLIGVEIGVLFRGGFASTQPYALKYFGRAIESVSCQNLTWKGRSVEGGIKEPIFKS